jgi:hypothetical protein
MAGKLSSERRTHNRLMLALKRAMESTLDDTTWKELGYLTDSLEWINGQTRLPQALYFGDSDYSSCVLDALEYILNRDPANTEVILDFGGIKEWLRKNEPAIYDEFCGGGIPAVRSLADAQKAAHSFDIDDHIRRIRESMDDDPALTFGSTKELLETVFKTVLGMHGASIGSDEIPKLLKRTQAALNLDAPDVDGTVPGAESFKKLLGSLAQIVVSITELRNLYGTRHGKSKAPGLDSGAAKLVVSAGTSLAAYSMNRYKDMHGQ